MSEYGYISEILGRSADSLAALEKDIEKFTARSGVIKQLAQDAEFSARTAAEKLGVEPGRPAEIKEALIRKVLRDDSALRVVLGDPASPDFFEKAAALARETGVVRDGFFLKETRVAEILRQRPPHTLLQFIKAGSVDEALTRHTVAEIMSALRFIESTEWMHETFRAAYSQLTPADFETRPIRVEVLGPEWRPVAEAFVAKKHHNVSHLKELGVIFLNPIAEGAPGTVIRDFALIFHYLHEIDFYADLFRRISQKSDFALRLESYLRGDVPETATVSPGEWLIIQRYLWKENPQDPRLGVIHANPESLHWRRAERDLAGIKMPDRDIDFSVWADRDWVHLRPASGEAPISFDLEDNAMSAVAQAAGREEYMNYHMREALWTELVSRALGGEEALDQAFKANLVSGRASFAK